MTLSGPYGPALACIVGLLAAGFGPAQQTPTQSAPAVGVFRVDAVAERFVAELPAGPLYWRAESAPAPFDAVGGGLTLTTEDQGRVWLFTLGPPGVRTPGMRLEAEIGPVPAPEATRYALRLNRAGGAPGARTAVHAHPGSEAFLVRAGRLCQRTLHGDAEVAAGQSMNGHAPGMVMQLTSCGEDDLDQWVVFVIDASKPFSSPASFE